MHLPLTDTEGSERTCVVTRRRGAPQTMIRFVRGPNGIITPDIRARLPGRGVWVEARAELVAQASKKGLFSKGLKEKIEAGPELAETVDRLLETDCLQMLALANKGGAVITGFNKVVEALEKGNLIGLIAALDGSAEGKRKLRQFARRCGVTTAPIVGLFRSNQLDLALGRTNVIHAALVKGGACESFLERCRKLAGYRGISLEGDSLENLNERHTSVTAAQLDAIDEENYRAGSGAGSEAG
jgi:uncharacterized protein